MKDKDKLRWFDSSSDDGLSSLLIQIIFDFTLEQNFILIYGTQNVGDKHLNGMKKIHARANSCVRKVVGILGKSLTRFGL